MNLPALIKELKIKLIKFNQKYKKSNKVQKIKKNLIILNIPQPPIPKELIKLPNKKKS